MLIIFEIISKISKLQVKIREATGEGQQLVWHYTDQQNEHICWLKVW